MDEDFGFRISQGHSVAAVDKYLGAGEGVSVDAHPLLAGLRGPSGHGVCLGPRQGAGMLVLELTLWLQLQIGRLEPARREASLCKTVPPALPGPGPLSKEAK